MSGFTGWVRNDPQKFTGEEEHVLNRMMESIAHRGTDSKDVYADDYIRFGFRNHHTEESIQNERRFLSYEDNRYWMVFDGVIYNQSELCSELKELGCVFQTESVIEILLTLYAQTGKQRFHDLRGAFSFVIWDQQEKTLCGVRDSFGIKPLYVLENDCGLYFASEMKSLYTTHAKEINSKALHHYLTYQYVPEPYTMQEKIRKIPPGHIFYKYPGEEMQLETYETIQLKPESFPVHHQTKKVKDVLRESVKRHMDTEMSVGAFLSGGIDSSTVVALAKEIDPHIPTFTVGFEREGFSEISIAKETAEQLEVENIHYTISPQEYIEVLPQVIRYMDDPVADPAAVPLYVANREAKKKVDVALSGEGADELFGGYTIYREPGDLRAFNVVPGPLKKMLYRLARQLPEGIRGKSLIERGTTNLEDRYIGNAKLFDEEEKSALLQAYNPDFHYTTITRPLFKQIHHYPAVHKMQYIDLHTWARGDILVKADRMSMAHELELRVPFLDKEVYQVAMKLLPEQKIAKGTTKYVLREAMREIVPDSVLYNRKLGFPVPIRHWLYNDLHDWAKHLIQNSPIDHLVYKPYVLELLEKHHPTKMDYSRKIWAVIVFVIWHQMYIEEVDIEPAVFSFS